jgi:hypothetical protein
LYAVNKTKHMKTKLIIAGAAVAGVAVLISYFVKKE